jgi:ATP-dependent protease ClpP protease subunit
VSINSEGGLVGEANRIRKLLDERRPWTAIARRAESAALFIFASANKRLLFSDSILLAHPVRYRGERDEETRQAERQLATVLSCSSGGRLSFADAVQMQQTEWRFSAAEALALGLADDII